MPSISTFADPATARAASGPDRPTLSQPVPLGQPREVTPTPAWQPAGWDAAPAPTTPPEPTPTAPTAPADRPRTAGRQATGRRASTSPSSFTAVLASLVALTTAATTMVVTAGSVRIGAAASHTTPYLAERPRGPAVVADPPVTGGGAGPTREERQDPPATRPSRRPEKAAAPTAARRPARPESGRRTAPAPSQRPAETSPAPDNTDLRRRLVDLCESARIVGCVRLADARSTDQRSNNLHRKRHHRQWRTADRDPDVRPRHRPGTRTTPRNADDRTCRAETRRRTHDCASRQLPTRPR